MIVPLNCKLLTVTGYWNQNCDCLNLTSRWWTNLKFPLWQVSIKSTWVQYGGDEHRIHNHKASCSRIKCYVSILQGHISASRIPEKWMHLEELQIVDFIRIQNHINVETMVSTNKSPILTKHEPIENIWNWKFFLFVIVGRLNCHICWHQEQITLSRNIEIWKDMGVKFNGHSKSFKITQMARECNPISRTKRN